MAFPEGLASHQGALLKGVPLYLVSRVTYTDKYRACIWMSLDEFRYKWYELVYVTLLTVKVLNYPINMNLFVWKAY